MIKNITFLLVLLAAFNSSCVNNGKPENERFGKYGIHFAKGNKLMFTVVNNADCINCLMPVRNFFDALSHDSMPVNLYVVLPEMREIIFQQFLKDAGIDVKRTKIVSSNEFVNIIAKESGVTEFTSFFCIYDASINKVIKTQLLKELSSSSDFKLLLQN